MYSTGVWSAADRVAGHANGNTPVATIETARKPLIPRPAQLVAPVLAKDTSQEQVRDRSGADLSERHERGAIHLARREDLAALVEDFEAERGLIDINAGLLPVPRPTTAHHVEIWRRGFD